MVVTKPDASRGEPLGADGAATGLSDSSAMLFPTSIFALFFAIVFAIHWLAVSRPRIRKAALLLGSLFFYGWWSWKFALMLLASALLNHAVAVWMDRLTDARARRRAVTLGVAANLLVLGVFKYAGFLVFHVFVPLAVPVCARLGTTGQLIHLQEQVDRKSVV